jgi:hypothetical protein
MTITTQPWHVIIYSLAFFMSVCVVSFNYATVQQDKLGRDLIIAQYEQAANIEIAKIQTESTKHYAIAEVWGCR